MRGGINVNFAEQQQNKTRIAHHRSMIRPQLSTLPLVSSPTQFHSDLSFGGWCSSLFCCGSSSRSRSLFRCRSSCGSFDWYGLLGLRGGTTGWGALLQLSENLRLEALWSCNAGPPSLDLAISANQELLKVPLNELHSEESRFLVLEPLVHGIGVVAVDLGLTQDWEGHAIVELAEVLNVIVGAGFLAAELVAREANDLEVGVLGADGLVELLETLVLRGEAALGGDVNYQDNFALVLVEWEWFTLFCKQRSGVLVCC